MDFTSIVNGWPFASPGELHKRIVLAEAYAATHALSERQRKVLGEMKQAAGKHTDK